MVPNFASSAAQPNHLHGPATERVGDAVPEDPLPRRVPAGGGGLSHQPLRSEGAGELTLYGPNSFFRRFSGHYLRWALFVYRLIGAMLIGNFFHDPFLK